MHINGCDIANDMVSNGQPWTWPPSFKIHNRSLSLIVVYIWSFLLFSFQVSSTQAVYSFTKWQWSRGLLDQKFDVGVPLVNAKIHPSLSRMKGPNRPHQEKWNNNSHSILNRYSPDLKIVVVLHYVSIRNLGCDQLTLDLSKSNLKWYWI